MAELNVYVEANFNGYSLRKDGRRATATSIGSEMAVMLFDCLCHLREGKKVS